MPAGLEYADAQQRQTPPPVTPSQDPLLLHALQIDMQDPDCLVFHQSKFCMSSNGPCNAQAWAAAAC